METLDEDHPLTDHTHDGGMRDKLHHVRLNVRSNPTKWAGIAAGAGFGLGLIGRIIRHRAADDSIPHIVIIEGDC